MWNSVSIFSAKHLLFKYKTSGKISEPSYTQGRMYNIDTVKNEGL